jgi:anti-sigma factor RsiW
MTGHTHRPDDPACLEVFARLSEFLDGELPECDCQEIERHIADCPPCVDFVRSLRESIEASHHFHGSERVPSVPAEVQNRLKAAWAAALARRTGCR